MNTITIHNQVLSYQGDASMLLCPITAFLCSHHVPAEVQIAVRKWVEGQDAENVCVVCGNMTGEERLVFNLCIARGIPVALALAHAIPQQLDELRLDAPAMAALSGGKMVIISPITDPNVNGASGRTSAARNRLMISIASKIVVGYMTENGNLASQLLGRHNVSILQPTLPHDSTTKNLAADEEIEMQDERYHQMQMAWAIYKQLKEGALDIDEDEAEEEQETESMQSAPLPSVEMRRLLAKYLKLTEVERPSKVHSLILFQVVRKYSKLPDFNFTAFLRLWNPEYLRPEDWRGTKIEKGWLPSLAERVMARLFLVLPSKFHAPINPNEQFDPVLAHAILDKALARDGKECARRPGRKPSSRLLQRALSLAYFEHNNEAISKYRLLSGKTNS